MPFNFHIEKLKLPENIRQDDRRFFEPYVTWHFSDPAIRKHFFSFVFLKGGITSFWMQPVRNMPPWPDFYKNHRRTFFLGKMLHAIKKRKMGWVATRKYHYCLNEFSDNYFHWFTEVLPKMIYARSKTNEDTRFFIPFALSRYQLDSLDICGIKFFQGQNEITLFVQLDVVENFTATGCYHPELLYATRNLLLREFRENKPDGKKVYVTRKHALRRHLLNEEEVRGIVLKHGFEIYDFDHLDFREQVSVARSASVLVSLHGAALTNMIFMEEGSVIIEFLPKETFNDKCYFTLAEIMKHTYYYLFCETDGESHITADYTVNVIEFEKILASVMQKESLAGNKREPG